MSKRLIFGVKASFEAAKLVVVSAFALAVIGSAVGARAASIKVDSIADDLNAGHCTLREAINSANGSPNIGNCTAGTGTDSIVFSVTGGIALESSLPTVAGKLTITGPASPGIILNGQSKFRVMDVDFSATLNISKLTIEHGSNFAGEGGGIRNSGRLTVTSCKFRNNSADGAAGGGGIFNNGTATVNKSTFYQNTAEGVFGGGVYNQLGKLTVSNSTFSHNSADGGGGITSNGTLTVTNCTFFANAAGIAGGGIENFGPGTVTNTTFSGNSANVAGANLEGAAMTSVKGTILAAPKVAGNCEGTITDGGYNIADDRSCVLLAATSRNDTDPKLDSAGLKNNGGTTNTIALVSGSPAIDAIPFASCTTQSTPPKQLTIDQRGFSRPDPADGAKGPCDIGAYEFQKFTLTPKP